VRPRLAAVTAPGYTERDYFDWRRARFRAFLERLGYAGPFDGRCAMRRIVDVGIGYGASSAVMAGQGALVMAGDIRADKLALAREFCPTARLARFDAQALPFPDRAFDGAVLFDALEHVADPELTLSEIKRVVRSKGPILIEFTPYYSLAGHHLYDYTLLPVQFLPRAWAHRYVRWQARRRGVDPAGALVLFDALNRLSIRAFHRLRQRLGLALLREAHTLRSFWSEMDVGWCQRLGPARELLATGYACWLENE